MKAKINAAWLKLSLIALAFLMVGCIPDHVDDMDLAAESELMLEDELNGENLRVNPAAQNQLLASVRKATAKYQRVEVAIAEGYELATPCVESGAGGMGFHYVKGSLIDGVLDPVNPEALVYEPLPNGKLNLAAIEYIVDARELKKPKIAPLFGQVPMDNHLSGPPLTYPHYQLHVWVWKNNPAGMYTPFNPKVSCKYSVEEENGHH